MTTAGAAAYGVAWTLVSVAVVLSVHQWRQRRAARLTACWTGTCGNCWSCRDVHRGRNHAR